jgi:uncharacterized protein with HEPN domain
MQQDKGYLLDILEAAKLAVSYIAGKTLQDFLSDIQCQDAVIRRLEIIGEASNKLSRQTRKAFSDIPWKEMIGMRNFMIHDYPDIDLVVVWETAHKDLPVLISAVEKHIASL